MLDPKLLGEKLENAATTGDSGDTKKLWLNIATEIINHITEKGVVNVTVATSGSATSQTGTGVGKLT